MAGDRILFEGTWDEVQKYNCEEKKFIPRHMTKDNSYIYKKTKEDKKVDVPSHVRGE